jgi:hypothetical protein
MNDTTQEELPIWVSTAPTDICLGLCWDGGSDEEHAGFPDDHEDICWSEGKNGHGDDNVHYVRADIANQCIATLKAENAAAQSQAAAMAGLLEEAIEDWVKVGYGASHEDVAAIQDFTCRSHAALAAWKGDTK